MDEMNANADSTEALLERYDRRRRRRNDDVTAMQAVICILIAVLMFSANLRYPQQVGELYHMVRTLALDGRDIMENPIDTAAKLL